jgi:tetratricopeptide (TPR) repeat protein
MTTKILSDVPATGSAAVKTALLRRAHAEAHDVYVPDGSPVDPSLKDECSAHYRALRFDDGIARAQQTPGWESNHDAVLYVAIGRYYQRRYNEAREGYAAAMTLSDDASFRGTCMANIATTRFEEGDFDRAREDYSHALTIDPLNEFALLGLVAIGCQRRDTDAVIRDATLLRSRWPNWQERPVITSMLRKDRSYRFLRDEPELFVRAMDISLNELTE